MHKLCGYVCVYLYTRGLCTSKKKIKIYGCTHAYIHTRTHTHKYIVNTCVRTVGNSMYSPCKHTHTHTHTHVHALICICVVFYTYTYMHVDMRIHIAYLHRHALRDTYMRKCAYINSARHIVVKHTGTHHLYGLYLHVHIICMYRQENGMYSPAHRRTLELQALSFKAASLCYMKNYSSKFLFTYTHTCLYVQGSMSLLYNPTLHAAQTKTHLFMFSWYTTCSHTKQSFTQAIQRKACFRSISHAELHMSVPKIMSMWAVFLDPRKHNTLDSYNKPFLSRNMAFLTLVNIPFLSLIINIFWFLIPFLSRKTEDPNRMQSVYSCAVASKEARAQKSKCSRVTHRCTLTKQETNSDQKATKSSKSKQKNSKVEALRMSEI